MKHPIRELYIKHKLNNENNRRLEPPTASDVLTTAKNIMDARGKLRDKANGERSMKRCIDAFNALYNTNLSTTQGWTFMLLLKLSRSAAGIFHPDDWYDCVAYSALATEEAFNDSPVYKDDD